MQRRHLLTAVASAAAGTGVASAAPAKRVPFPFIETDERTRLFYKDWGAGRPVVFIHGWAMNADMWQYR
jgi:hypothetical protein